MAHLSGGKWTPFKELLHVVGSAVMERQPGAYYELDAQLTKNKPNLISLLQHAPKNSAHRSEVRSSVSVPIKLPGYKTRQTFPQVFIDEALILSNILNLNEFSSVELLLTAEQQQPRFPWLPRGLVSVLLYHDGRHCLLRALKMLIQAREGVSWSYELDANISTLIMNFTNELFEDGLVEKILKLLEGLTVEGELEKLRKGRAVGGDRHKAQLVDLIEEQRSLLAECLFYWACQNPFPSEQTIAVLRYLKNSPPPSDGVLDIVTLTLFMTVLYCFNIGEPNADNFTDSLMDSKFPLSSDACFLSAVHQVVTEEGDWTNPSLQAAVKFGWAVLLRECSNWEAFSDKEELADDEKLLDEVVGRQVFTFLQEAVIGCKSFHQEEYFVRRLHWLVTTFIAMMPLKIRDLHNRCSEEGGMALRKPANQMQPAIVTPKKAMESLMTMVGDLYGCDVHQLELCLDYWPASSSGEVSIMRGAHYSRVSHKQVTLNKFVHQCSSHLPSTLFIPFLHMLNGLCTGTKAAGYVFDALKAWQQPGAANNISWDHFFGSIQQYSLGLKQSMGTPQTASGCAVTPEELAGLEAVLQLIRAVIDQNEAVRVAMAENKLWSPVQSLFILLSCAIPYSLKADVLLTLASFAKSPEIAASMWHILEQSQVFSTIPLDAHQGGMFKSQLSLREGSVQLELEEVESQAQEYPETRAFLCLLDALTDVPVPPALGAGQRSQTGFQPYLNYLRDSVLLRFDVRSYRLADEKWQVSTAVMKILLKLLRNYDCSGPVAPGDPGHILMRHMLNNSQFLKKILFIVHEGAVTLSKATNSTSNCLTRENISRAALLALQLLEVGLSKQEAFLVQLKGQSSGAREVNVTPLDELMMSINPHSGQADHLINVTKYVTFLSCSPELAQSAVRILCWIVRSSRIGSKFVNILHHNQETWRDIQNGFVEWLESVHDSQTSEAVMAVQASLREDIVKLLVYSVNTPAPNIAHLLLGYDITKPIQETNLQDPGVMNHPRTCLHSVLSLVEPTSSYNSMACHHSDPKLAMLCYQLIYLLCSNKTLSAPTLRYLRSNHNFFHVQVVELPMTKEGFAHDKELCSSEQLALVRQLSWLLKSVAVELRMTAVARQRSYFQGLVDVLVDESPTLETSYQSGIIQNKRRILHLLNSVEFGNRDVPQLELMHINVDRLEEVIGGLTIYDETTGIQFTDVKLLRKTMMGDLGAQGIGAAGHGPQIMEEVHEVLEHVVERNLVTDNNHAQCELFNAWRQVVEVMMTSSGSHDVLQSDPRMALLFELLHDLLLKLEGETLPELSVAGHGVVLTLMSLLKQTFQKIEGANSDAMSISRLQPGPMQGILRRLLEGLMQATNGQQLSRAYLYGALLYYLQLTSEQNGDQFTGPYLQPGYEQGSLMAGNVHILSSYGNALMETICKDACSGHDVDKMLALSLLHSIVSIDLSQSWLQYMHMNGYLQTICSSLQMDDANLQRALKPAPEPLRALYIYESKMAFLSGVAKTPLGCKYLLHSNCLVYLSECQFLDMFPNLEAHHGYISLLSQPIGTVDDQFVPTVIDRYNNQMLRPALSLAVTLITSSGPHKQETILQVSRFVLAHLELFGTILRDHMSSMSLGSLEILALTTSLISHCGIGQNISNVSSGEEHAEQLVGLSRIQRLMLSLMPKYCSTNNWRLLLKEAEKELIEGDDSEHFNENMKQQLLDQCQTVCANLIAYCATIMTNKESPRAHCNIVFSPDLVTKHPQWESLGGQAQAYTPTLGLLLHLLKECITDCQVVMEDSVNGSSGKEGKKSDLHKSRIKQYIYIIENCLYILWKHLEFYLLSVGAQLSSRQVVRQYMRNLKGGNVVSAGRIGGMDTNMSSLSLDQIQAADFTFLKKLMDLRKIKEQEVEGSTGFIHAMIFRIKRLIKPAMTKQPVSQ